MTSPNLVHSQIINAWQVCFGFAITIRIADDGTFCLKLDAKSDKMMQIWFCASFILGGTLRKSPHQSFC